MLSSLQSFIYFSACLSTSSSVSSTLSQFVQLPQWPPCPQGNPLPKVKAKSALLKWDWFRQAGGEQDHSNKSTSSCLRGIKACDQQLVKQQSALAVVAAADELVIVLLVMDTGQ